MNTKFLFCFAFLFAVTLATSTVDAGQRHRNNNRVAFKQSRNGGTRSFVGGNRVTSWNGQHWNHQNWNGRNWNAARWNNWNWHHHHRSRSFVFVDVGFPFWGWGYPYYYDYYPYGYYGGGYYGYNSGYYGSSTYSYGNQYGYDNNSGNGYTNGSNVAELQRKLADAGYYRGPIDGIMGSRTYYALKAFRHDHANGKNINGGYSPTLRDKPYSPPPVTTEPESTE